MTTALRALAVLLAAAATVTLPTPAAASAGLLDVTCTTPSSQTITYNPPLTMTPQTGTLTVSGSYAPCVSLSQPGLTSGTRSGAGPFTDRTCLALFDPLPATFTITWNTGQTSTLSGTFLSQMVGAALVSTFTGSVTSGLFAGATAVQVNTAPATDITLCTLGLGAVPSVYATVQLEITTL